MASTVTAKLSDEEREAREAEKAAAEQIVRDRIAAEFAEALTAVEQAMADHQAAIWRRRATLDHGPLDLERLEAEFGLRSAQAALTAAKLRLRGLHWRITPGEQHGGMPWLREDEPDERFRYESSI